MPGDLTLVESGNHMPVVVEADGTGAAPAYGDPVAIVGESDRGTHVSLPGAAGEAVGILERENLQTDGEGGYVPQDEATYDANEVLGDSSALVRKSVDWVPAGGFAGAAGDLMIIAADGTAMAYDDTSTANGGAGHTPEMIFGRVWTTLQRAEGTATKVAVLRH